MSFDLSDKESIAKMRDSDEPNPSLSLVLKLMDSLVQKKQVNTDKVYVSGLSMGGMGTFEILYRLGLFVCYLVVSLYIQFYFLQATFYMAKLIMGFHF